MDAVPPDEWIVGLPQNDPRYIRLLGDASSLDLILAVQRDVRAQLLDRKISPLFEVAQRHAHYKRFTTELRLSEHTFDLLINGRMGYRAQYYLSLKQGRLFNRNVINALIPLMETAWKARSNEGWELALRSLTERDAKIWLSLDEVAFKSQPKLEAAMWVLNCVETKASNRGLHLASINPPKIELKGAWVSQDGSVWLPAQKRCRDELLRCFGFT